MRPYAPSRLRRLAQACLDLGQRLVERAAPGSAGGEHDSGVLVVAQERFACPGLGLARCCSGSWPASCESMR